MSIFQVTWDSSGVSLSLWSTINIVKLQGVQQRWGGVHISWWNKVIMALVFKLSQSPWPSNWLVRELIASLHWTRERKKSQSLAEYWRHEARSQIRSWFSKTPPKLLLLCKKWNRTSSDSLTFEEWYDDTNRIKIYSKMTFVCLRFVLMHLPDNLTFKVKW